MGRTPARLKDVKKPMEESNALSGFGAELDIFLLKKQFELDNLVS